MNPDQAALRLIPALYDAAVCEDRMQSVMVECGHVFPGHMVGIQLRLPELDRPPVIYSHGGDPASTRRYEEYYHTIDPATPLLTRTRRGEIIDTEHTIEEGRALHSEYYMDFLRPHGLAWGPAYIAPLEKRGDTPLSSFFVSRKLRARVLGPAELRLMQIMVPHLIGARQVWAALDDAAVRERGLAAALDTMPMGVMIVDAQWRVLWTSRVADEILARRDGLRLERGELRAEAGYASASLEKRIGEATRCAAGENVEGGGALAIPRPSGGRAYEVLATPLNRETSLAALDLLGVAAVFIVDPDAEPPDAAQVLRALYSLTPAESALALALAADLSIAQSAERLGITLETARQRLKMLFAKTGVQRQASLVRLLVRGPASLATRGSGGALATQRDVERPGRGVS